MLYYVGQNEAGAGLQSDQESWGLMPGGWGLLFPFAVDGPPMMASAHVSQPPKKPNKMGFDEVSFQRMELGWGG